VSLDVQSVLAEIDDVLARCGASKDRPSPPIRNGAVVGHPGQIVSACVACIERNAPHPSYVRTARELTRDARMSSATMQRVVGVLVSVRQDIEAGYTKTLEERVRLSVFDDLLETAEHIAENIAAAPAVVLAVSVLEEHVRKLAEASNISTTRTDGRYRSFEELITDLGSSEVDVFSLPERRQMGGWYAQRTAAAHGRFDEVVDEDVPRTIAGVRDLLVRHPA
jgi:hypothetical protein